MCHSSQLLPFQKSSEVKPVLLSFISLVRWNMKCFLMCSLGCKLVCTRSSCLHNIKLLASWNIHCERNAEKPPLQQKALLRTTPDSGVNSRLLYTAPHPPAAACPFNYKGVLIIFHTNVWILWRIIYSVRVSDINISCVSYQLWYNLAHFIGDTMFQILCALLYSKTKSIS